MPEPDIKPVDPNLGHPDIGLKNPGWRLHDKTVRFQPQKTHNVSRATEAVLVVRINLKTEIKFKTTRRRVKITAIGVNTHAAKVAAGNSVGRNKLGARHTGQEDWRIAPEPSADKRIERRAGAGIRRRDRNKRGCQGSGNTASTARGVAPVLHPAIRVSGRRIIPDEWANNGCLFSGVIKYARFIKPTGKIRLVKDISIGIR